MKQSEDAPASGLVAASAARGDSNRDPSFEEWVEGTLTELAQARQMVEHWLGELSHWLEWPDASLDADHRDRALCERTRMVVVAGEVLHSLTRIFVRWSELPAPESAWDAELAARADSLLARAAVEARTDPHKTNCLNRLAYVRGAWSAWCPAFGPPSGARPSGSSG